jgi:hypothetical protein
MLSAQRSGEQLLGFWADTVFVKMVDNINYVVRHPSSGDLYFTMVDKRGRSLLYHTYPNADSTKTYVKQVKLGKRMLFDPGMTVEHPTFTADGQIMIFSSIDKNRGLGGYDLWYTTFDGKEWGKPKNLGSRINTSADEISPSIYRDCLLFSTNGQKEDAGHFSIYSTRLVSDRVIGDTVGMLQIGRCRVQRLPVPLNAPDADDFDMTIDTVTGCGYWVSRRDANVSDSQLYSFSGALDGVLVWGVVTDRFERTLAGVKVSALQGNQPVCNTYSDVDGRYSMYLQGGEFYEMAFSLDEYFTGYEVVNTEKADNEFLISESRKDVVLDRLPLDQRIVFSDLFGPNVDVELSEHGVEQLEPLVRFLNDNPELEVSMVVRNDITDNYRFNCMLTDQRVMTLRGYLYSVLPASVKLSVENGCLNPHGCCDASGISRVAVTISRPSKTEK